MKHSEISRWFSREARRWAGQNPARTMRLALKKAYAFWGAVEIVSERDLNLARRESLLLRLLPINSVSVFATAALGLLLACPLVRRTKVSVGTRERTDSASVILPPLFVLVYFLSFLPFFVTARYRVPIMPILLVYAAHGACSLASYLSRRQLKPAVLCLVVIAAVYVFLSLNLHGYEYNAAKGEYDKAVSLDRKEEYDEAMKYYRLAIRDNPGHARAHNNLGYTLQTLGRTNEAVDHYLAAIDSDPYDSKAYHNLGALWVIMGQGDMAVRLLDSGVKNNPDDTGLRHSLGLGHAAQGRFNEAEAQFRQALELDPSASDIRVSLGWSMFRRGAVADAERELNSVLLSHPDSLSARNRLGMVLLARKRWREALDHFQAVLNTAPNDPMARTGAQEAARSLNAERTATTSPAGK